MNEMNENLELATNRFPMKFNLFYIYPIVPGLNADSSGCECGVPILGDGCILLYGDMLHLHKVKIEIKSDIAALSTLGQCKFIPCARNRTL